MELVGYTEEEERQIMEINKIRDPEALAKAKEDFEARTGKEFPCIVLALNIDTMFAESRVSRGEFEKWVADG
ncbi:MAG: hypothetical protein UY31_C0072G0010, partial [Candidatus Wolfebacteria bacterium GW2011_GWE1_48_7]